MLLTAICRRLLNRYLSLYTSVSAKASIFYILSNVLQKITSFLMIPALTNILSVEEFGLYVVILSWSSIFEIFATMRIYSNSYMAGLARNGENIDAYTRSVQVIEILLISFVCLIFEFFSNALYMFTGIDTFFIRMMFLSYYASSSIAIWLAKQRFFYKYHNMFAVAVLSGVVIPLIAVLGIYIYKANLVVFFAIKSLFEILLAVPFVYINIKGTLDKINWTACYDIVKYNIPLIPYYLSMVIVNSSDRIMIQKIIGEEAAAIYSIAYSLSMSMFVFVGAFNFTLQPWIFKKLSKNNQASVKHKFNNFFVVVLCLNVLLLFLSPLIIPVMSSAKYYNAVLVMPPLIFSLLIMFIYQQFLNIILYYGWNRIIFVVSIIAAFANVFMNLLFLPLGGYLVAGYTTLISYCITFCGYFYFMIKLCRKEDIDYRLYFDLGGIFKIICSYVVIMFVWWFFYEIV